MLLETALRPPDVVEVEASEVVEHGFARVRADVHGGLEVGAPEVLRNAVRCACCAEGLT